MRYVEVILPLPLEGTFTYVVPDALLDKVVPCVRLLVPFGKTKTYIGICDTYPSDHPNNNDDNDGIKYKAILAILDDGPVLLPQQLQLWHWIANYYMSPIGDVYKAALPSGLKGEDTYKPHTEEYVCLGKQFRGEQELHIALDGLARATKQQKVLMSYLELSGIANVPELVSTDVTQTDNKQHNQLRAVSKDELRNTTHCSLAIINSLIEKGILQTYRKEVSRLNNSYDKLQPNAIHALNDAQTIAYDKILLQMMAHNVTLLHGVTSSGKTEIYIHLIFKALQEHKQVLYLLPEIALTVQITNRLRCVFGNKLGIYHSRYNDEERVEIWQKQLSNEPYEVILGARSAVFLPFQRLGLVIIDEEHENSFKQQDPAPRYHARSVAIVLAQMYGAKTLLGTATPSIESYRNAQLGKYGLVTLSQRYKDIQLPTIEVVNIKDLRRRKLMSGPFSPRLIAAVRDALQRGEQAILFQNRRGFAPMIECRTCGWVPHCPNCDVSLTYHKSMNVLTCHYCGYTERVPEQCPNCESKDIKGRGYGTEKIEDEIMEVFPDARIARMDLDTTRTKNAYERLINDFSAGKTNLLIGTQMVSKGLDFDHVSVVGILDADNMLNYPDFRAYEHAFTMMAQVSGRAGRKGKQGLVILQTKNPELPVIQQVVNNSYMAFYKSQLEERTAFHYPPFFHLIYIYIKHRNNDIVESASMELGSRIREIFGNRVLGPDKPTVARVKTLHIRKIMLKLENGIDYKLAKQYLRSIQDTMMKEKRYGALTIYFDVDPL
ncbi:MAG: primosomal protein N' [Prevotella pallens]|uniref:replication restart helicase PriA n=1 Tax=Prevotella pallens TaxID=60133 RepID=UPI001CB217F0|nr:primosomal protein N' [Prevotella pallens]MBF1443812.1 primosomal protein N' [Prevotella pallens]MBF1484875.1 primosomal protein N' [Prevotella pallens]MBF1489799.1 primosomal protein N' [Prevotella pallens]MBF1491258.1 primosomal protein N' [Prevotella pallens]MBF1493651.1 primosomal protein N' [Prevotella pallens]